MTKWVIGLILAIVFILPPIIILRSWMYGTNGTGITILSMIYAGVIAAICYFFFDDYLKRFNINWIHAFTGLIFGFIPWVAIMLGFFVAGVFLNEKYTNEERHRELQTEVVDKVNSNREKFLTIDSLISAYRMIEPALSADNITEYEPMYLSESKLNKKIKDFKKVYAYLKKDHENYKQIENDSQTVRAPMLFWYCDENGGHMKDAAFQDFFNSEIGKGPVGNEFEINVFADIEKLEAYIDSCEHLGIERWNMTQRIKQCVNTLDSAKYMSIIKNKYLISPCIQPPSYWAGMLKVEVYVWDFSRHSFVDTLQVYTENSSQLKTSSPYKIITDDKVLYDNLYENLHHDLLKVLKSKGY